MYTFLPPLSSTRKSEKVKLIISVAIKPLKTIAVLSCMLGRTYLPCSACNKSHKAQMLLGTEFHWVQPGRKSSLKQELASYFVFLSIMLSRGHAKRGIPQVRWFLILYNLKSQNQNFELDLVLNLELGQLSKHGSNIGCWSCHLKDQGHWTSCNFWIILKGSST